MRRPSFSLPVMLLGLSVFLGLGACDKSGAQTETPSDQPQAQPEEEYVPEPVSDLGDGTVTGIAKLSWGAPAPEGSNLRVTFWRNGEIVQHHMVPVGGPGPWAFEFQAEGASSFVPEDRFGLGVMIETPPDGEAWYMGDPPSLQIWKHGEGDGAIEVKLIPIDPRAAGDGPPSE